ECLRNPFPASKIAENGPWDRRQWQDTNNILTLWESLFARITRRRKIGKSLGNSKDCGQCTATSPGLAGAEYETAGRWRDHRGRDDTKATRIRDPVGTARRVRAPARRCSRQPARNPAVPTTDSAHRQ